MAELIEWSGELPRLLTQGQMTKLGRALDTAERRCSQADKTNEGRPVAGFNEFCDRLFIAEQAYRGAVYDRSFAIKVKVERAARVPRYGDAFRLRDAMLSAMAKRDQMEELWPTFATKRELIDARAAADLAEHLYHVAETKFQDAQRGARADKRAGIVRRRSNSMIIRK